MIPFDKMSRFYDAMYSVNFSAKMVPYTLQILERNNFSPETILDLCCGTGTALLYFDDEGFEVDGLDRSGGMLSIASKKLKGRKIGLHKQALPDFRITHSRGRQKGVIKRYDLITSFYDSLNFLTTVHDLYTAFRAVNRHLRPGGWFIFDMNTVKMFEPLWNEHPWVGIQDDLMWVMRSQFLKSKSMTLLHGTYLDKQGRHWRRYDEIMYERAYSNR